MLLNAVQIFKHVAGAQAGYVTEQDGVARLSCTSRTFGVADLEGGHLPREAALDGDDVGGHDLN